MSWQWWCACLGLIFVTAGAVLALIGFRKTWSECAAREKFWRALTSWLPRWWGTARKTIVAAYNRIIHHKRYVTDSDRLTAVEAVAGVGYDVQPLDFPEGDELPEVVRKLWQRHADLELRFGNYMQQTTQALSSAQEDIRKRVMLIDERVIRVAVGGLSLQAWGLILVTAGTALSSVPTLAQVSSDPRHAPAPVASSTHSAAHAATHATSIWAAVVPGWITGAGTGLLAVFAIVTAYYARKAFIEQSQEVGHQAALLKLQSDQLEEQRKIGAEQTTVLRLQATELNESLDERKQEAHLRKRAQAERVFIAQQNTVSVRPDEDDEPEAHCARVTVGNTSDRPVYEATLRWPQDSSWDWNGIPEPLGSVMPGDRIERVQYFPLGTDMALTGAVLMFRDAAGNIWIRKPDGDLAEQEQRLPGSGLADVCTSGSHRATFRSRAAMHYQDTIRERRQAADYTRRPIWAHPTRLAAAWPGERGPGNQKGNCRRPTRPRRTLLARSAQCDQSGRALPGQRPPGCNISAVTGSPSATPRARVRIRTLSCVPVGHRRCPTQDLRPLHRRAG